MARLPRPHTIHFCCLVAREVKMPCQSLANPHRIFNEKVTFEFRRESVFRIFVRESDFWIFVWESDIFPCAVFRAHENGFARAFGGDGGTCVCRGKVTSRLSPCFAGELRILLSSIFGKKNPLGRFILLFSGCPKVPAQKIVFAREHTSQGWRGEGERIQKARETYWSTESLLSWKV
jgi:hypothetical protein